MHVPYLTDVQANWLFIVLVAVGFLSGFKILYNEYVRSLLRKDYLAKAAEEDGCNKIAVFRRAAKDSSESITRHQVIEDYKRYSSGGANGVYPQYVRAYLKNRFRMM